MPCFGNINYRNAFNFIKFPTFCLGTVNIYPFLFLFFVDLEILGTYILY